MIEIETTCVCKSNFLRRMTFIETILYNRMNCVYP